MSDLETIARSLVESLDASTSKSAEKYLKTLETQDGFGITLLHVVASTNLPISTRLAGALFFKNFIKRKWADEDGNYLIPLGNAELIKKEIVPLMISLPNNLQVQIGEAVSVIADSDFPHRWPALLGDLASRLSEDDMVTNKGVLTVAHSIFKRWRPLFRSDELFLEIKMVIDVFALPLLNLLKSVDIQITANEKDEARLNFLFDVLLVLTKLYYDFNCQDIPEFFEDNLSVGMGIFHKYLAYQNDLLEDPDEEERANTLTKVKSAIQELVQLYTTRYGDVFGPLVQEFIQITWSLLTSTPTTPKYDILVSKSLNFLTAVARISEYFEIFNSKEAMNNITEQIILPNVTLRDSDIELFEDDPIEYIRRDLEGSDTDTRRRACADFLKELKEKNEQLLTSVLMSHMNQFFEQYAAQPAKNWKFKNLCVYIFTTLAIRGNLTGIGVSSTNPALDVVEFFTKHVAPDLTGAVNHPIQRVDAIKYIYVFRNQLNKGQLIEIMPLLAKFLQSNEYVEYTYAAVTIEKILTIRESITSNVFVFTKSDLTGSAEILLSNLLNLILKQGSTPEKLAENEFLMRAWFRVLQTSEDLVSDKFLQLMTQLLQIISLISKNPSNPRFSHYTFEAVGVILVYCKIESLSPLIELMMPVFLHILSEDIQEFMPYVFQLIAYCIEKGMEVPQSIKEISQSLLAPSLWESKGNIPAVTRVLKAIMKVDNAIFPDLMPVLGVFQRLIASKAQENYAFELLEYILYFVDTEKLKPYLKQITVLLLQRLQNSRTERLVKKIAVLFGMISIKFGANFVIQFVDEVQNGLFLPIWSSFIIPTLPSLGNLLERKIATVGALKVVTSNDPLLGSYASIIPPTFESIIAVISTESLAHLKNEYVNLENLDEISTFGSSFSRLSSVIEKPFDPVPEIDPVDGLKAYVAASIKNYSKESAPALQSVISQLPEKPQQQLQQLLSLN